MFFTNLQQQLLGALIGMSLGIASFCVLYFVFRTYGRAGAEIAGMILMCGAVGFAFGPEMCESSKKTK